jgi:spoIIIJ-associated protein
MHRIPVIPQLVSQLVCVRGKRSDKRGGGISRHREDDAMTDNINLESLDVEQQEALNIFREMCSLMDINVEPEVIAVHTPYIEINLVGADAENAFGKYGKRLDALQFLANTVLSKKINGDVRLVLDCAGYREKRAHVLEELAHELAAQVKLRQEECELDALPAHERRVIHNALANDPDVRTYSEGMDLERHVVIAPRE